MNTNDYIKIFEDFKAEARNMVCETEHSKSRVVIQSLPSLSMKGVGELFLHAAEVMESGDNSYFYVNPNVDVKELYKYLRIEESPAAVWELYLLMSSSTFMPFIWHGGYNQRKYVFSVNDIAETEALKGRDISLIAQHFDLSPSVTKVDSSNQNEHIYQVESCYWSEWKGLVRETVRVTIRNHEITDYTIICAFTIYQYDCGIYF